MILRWMSKTPGEYIFPLAQWEAYKKDLAKQLKITNPEWGLKALRRGSLSTMARNGVPLSTLRLFSGHTSEAALLRYLRYGLHAEHQNRLGEEAAHHLHHTMGPQPAAPTQQ